jgi:hypothetical protein
MVATRQGRRQLRSGGRYSRTGPIASAKVRASKPLSPRLTPKHVKVAQTCHPAVPMGTNSFSTVVSRDHQSAWTQSPRGDEPHQQYMDAAVMDNGIGTELSNEREGEPPVTETVDFLSHQDQGKSIAGHPTSAQVQTGHCQDPARNSAAKGMALPILQVQNPSDEPPIDHSGGMHLPNLEDVGIPEDNRWPWKSAYEKRYCRKHWDREFLLSYDGRWMRPCDFNATDASQVLETKLERYKRRPWLLNSQKRAHQAECGSRLLSHVDAVLEKSWLKDDEIYLVRWRFCWTPRKDVDDIDGARASLRKYKKNCWSSRRKTGNSNRWTFWDNARTLKNLSESCVERWSSPCNDEETSTDEDDVSGHGSASSDLAAD